MVFAEAGTSWKSQYLASLVKHHNSSGKFLVFIYFFFIFRLSQCELKVFE